MSAPQETIVAMVCDAIEISAQAATGKPRTFSMAAYNGGALQLTGWALPVVVDLAGLDVGASSRPIYINHQTGDPSLEYLMGQSDSIGNNGRSLVATGRITAVSPTAKRAVELHDAGFKFQASIGARVISRDVIPQGQTATANGRQFSGPVVIARKSTLGEISFVPLGADDTTAASISATRGKIMPPENTTTINEAEESRRIETIRATCKVKMSFNGRLVDHHFHDVEAQAIGEGWDLRKTAAEVARRQDLETLRAGRPSVGNVGPSNGNAGINSGSAWGSIESKNIIAAAALMHVGKSQLAEKTYGAQVANQANDLRCSSLLDLCAAALEMEGRDVPRSPQSLVQAAVSTASLPYALGAISEKIAAETFQTAPGVWGKVCRQRNVRNFKDNTIVRLFLGGDFSAIGNGGELKSGNLTDQALTTSIDTKGQVIWVTRKDLINDDLGLFTDLSAGLGRNAARAMNDDFANLLLSGTSSYFSSGNKNLISGAPSALSADSLASAMTKMRQQVDALGRPVDIIPQFLMVPPELEITGRQILQSASVQRYVSSSNDNRPMGNPMFELMELLVEPRLSNANYTSYSLTAWYLFSGAMNGAINLALLHGVLGPTIEQVQPDPDTLGIGYRAYIDYGFTTGESVAATKSAGA